MAELSQREQKDAIKRLEDAVDIVSIYENNSNAWSHYAYFVQFDWLTKTFYTSINSMSRNFGTIFLPPAPKMYNDDKNMILMTKWEL